MPRPTRPFFRPLGVLAAALVLGVAAACSSPSAASPTPTAMMEESPSPSAMMEESPSPSAMMEESPSPSAMMEESPSPSAP